VNKESLKGKINSRITTVSNYKRPHFWSAYFSWQLNTHIFTPPSRPSSHSAYFNLFVKLSPYNTLIFYCSMFKGVHVGVRLPINSEWNKMSEQQPSASQASTSNQASTGSSDGMRYIYERIKIGDDSLVAAVSVSHPMTLRDYEMGNRSADIRGEVEAERTERMAQDHAAALMARGMALQRQYEARQEPTNTTAGASTYFVTPGTRLG
jgi:hypothetical protein